MQYVDYEYYKDVYKGTLVTNEDDFDRLEAQAQMILDNYTLKRKKTEHMLEHSKFAKNIKYTVCEIIENLSRYEELQANAIKSMTVISKGIKSESIKDHSVGFNDKETLAIDLENAFNTTNTMIIKRYLQITGLLYRGLR